MQKTGVLEKTSDGGFTGEEIQVKDMEKRVTILQKEGKACLDAMKLLMGSKIVDDLEEMGLSGSEMPRYKEMWKMMEELTVNELVLTILMTLR